MLRDEGVEENIVYFLLHCDELLVIEEGYWVWLKALQGTEEWLAEWRNRGDEARVGLLLGRKVAG